MGTIIGVNPTSQYSGCGGFVETGKIKISSSDNVLDYLGNKINDSEHIKVVTEYELQQDGAKYYSLKLMFSDEIWDLITTKISGGTSSGTTIVGGDSGVEYDSIRLRGDSLSNWVSVNPVLALDEPTVVFLQDGSVRLKIGDGIKTFVNLPYVSMGGENELTLDKELVPVSLTGVWYSPSGTPLSSSYNFNSIEKGAVIKWIGHFKWVHDNNKKDPTKILEESDFYGFSLPSSNQYSSDLTVTGITEDLTISAKIAAPKIGYEVINGKLVAAYGDDISTSEMKINFRDRIFFGKTTTKVITSTIINNFKNSVPNTKLIDFINETITGITTNTTEYYTFCYPRDNGLLSTIIQNRGMGVLEAFDLSELTITNEFGAQVQLYCYTSKYRGAFSNATLNFLI